MWFFRAGQKTLLLGLLQTFAIWTLLISNANMQRIIIFLKRSHVVTSLLLLARVGYVLGAISTLIFVQKLNQKIPSLRLSRISIALFV